MCNVRQLSPSQRLSHGKQFALSGLVGCFLNIPQPGIKPNFPWCVGQYVYQGGPSRGYFDFCHFFESQTVVLTTLRYSAETEYSELVSIFEHLRISHFKNVDIWGGHQDEILTFSIFFELQTVLLTNLRYLAETEYSELVSIFEHLGNSHF